MSKTIGQWLMDASPTEYILAFAAIASAGIAYAQYSLTKGEIESKAAATLAAAKQASDQSALNTETFLADQLARQKPRGPAWNNAPVSATKFVVQLATYRSENCDRAERAAKRYEPAFAVKPQLFESPSKRYVVVALPTNTNEAALELLAKAQKLALTEKYKKEDFENASIRRNPEWKAISSCPVVAQ